MSSVVNDLKSMDGPLPAPLAQLKELAKVGSVVMQMNNTQRALFFAVVLQVVMSLSALSVTSSSVKSSVKGRVMTIFGALLMVFAGMSAFYGMVTLPKSGGMGASGAKIATGGAILMTLGIIAFSVGYGMMKTDLGGKDDELKKALTMNILAILFSVAVFGAIAMKFHPVMPKSSSSFGSYDFRHF